MILGTPIPGTYVLVGGEHRQLDQVLDGGALLQGEEQPVPFDRVEAVLFAQQEEPRPASRVFPAPAGYGTFPDRTDQVRDLERALHEAVVAGLPEETVKGSTDGVGDVISYVPHQVQEGVSAVKDWGTEAWSDLKDFGSDAWSGVKDAGSKIKDLFS